MQAVVLVPGEGYVGKGNCAWLVCRVRGMARERRALPSSFLVCPPPRHHTAKESGGARSSTHFPPSQHTRCLVLASCGRPRSEWLRRGTDEKQEEEGGMTKRSGGREAAKGWCGLADDERTRPAAAAAAVRRLIALPHAPRGVFMSPRFFLRWHVLAALCKGTIRGWITMHHDAHL